MIGEHEIPVGSNLYFGKSAKLKRELETKACEILASNGFEEIVTPYFTFANHSRNDIADSNKTIRLSDKDNNYLILRPDSSLDVIRLITKRLGRSTKHKKWFYIQPVFEYPSSEINQIGAEFMDCDNDVQMIKLASEILTESKIDFTLQLSNSLLPKLAASESGLDFELFKNKAVSRLKEAKIEWLNTLVAIEDCSDLKKNLEIMPQKIKKELQKLYDCATILGKNNVKIDALYVSSAGYYSGIFFRIFDKNEIFIKGGSYKANGKNSFGFAVYTDNIIKKLETENR